MSPARRTPPSRRTTVSKPTMGVFLDRTPTQVPSQGMQDCLNVRIKEGQIRNENMGWETFPPGGTALNLDSEQVLLIDQLFLRNGSQFLIFASKFDLFRYDTVAEDVKYITPIYAAGTVTAAVYSAGPDETTITGTGTLWSTVQSDRDDDDNVEVDDMFHLGSATQELQTASWYLVKSITSDTEIVVDGDASSDFVGPNDPYTIRQRFSGDELNLWSSDIFPAFDAGAQLNDHWYATNGVNNVVRWRGTSLDAFATRVDLGFTCKVVRRFKNMMLYFGLEEGGDLKPQTIRNSDVAKPEDVTNGLASEFVPSEGVDPILTAESLGDLLVVYNEQSVNVLQFVGDPFIFIARTAIPNRGPIAAGAVIDFGDHHEFLSDVTAYSFNGVGIQEVGPQVFKEVLRTIDPTRREKIITHLDDENAEAQWIVPLTTDASGELGGPRKAYTEHYTQEFQFEGGPLVPFTIRELPATATGYFDRQGTLTWQDVLSEWRNTNFRWNDRFFSAAFPLNLFGDQNGYIFTLGTTDSQHDGVSTQPLTSRVRTARRPVMDGHQKGVVRRLYPGAPIRVTANYSLGVALFGSDREDGAAVLLAGSPYALTHAGERFVPFLSVARFAEFQFTTAGEQQPWELSGWAIESVACGSR